MDERVVVLGAGYAGCVAVRTLEKVVDDVALTWVSDNDYHLVRHEVHRAVRDPSIREKITIPVESIKAASTEFVHGRVESIDPHDRLIDLSDGSAIEFDYALVALGSHTAFYGIPGLAERCHTVDDLDDAIAIHRAVTEAGTARDRNEPARVVVGGAGLSGIQTAGELAELRDEHDLPIEITLVEALPEIMPGADRAIQQRLRHLLRSRGINILTDDPVTEVRPEEIQFEERSPIPYAELIWTGGITGREAFADTVIANDHRRLKADATFRTSHDRVFAVGDAAVVGLDGDQAPPTAQAAWDAAAVAAENLARATRGKPLERWSYEDKGTLISVGDDAVAYDVRYVPVATFGGLPANFLKKFVATRWIASLTSWRRGLAAWETL